MPDVLNLAGADTNMTFDPIPSGWYPATIVKFEERFTKGGEDKALPGGTPMINFHFKIKEGTVAIDSEGKEIQVGGKYQFRQFIVPPAKIAGKPYEHYKSMMSQLATFFSKCGFDNKKVTSPDGFDWKDEIVGCEIGIKVKLYFNKFKNEEDNDVTGFKPIGDIAELVGAAGGLT